MFLAVRIGLFCQKENHLKYGFPLIRNRRYDRMNILVCVKPVPGAAEIQINPMKSAVNGVMGALSEVLFALEDKIRKVWG